MTAVQQWWFNSVRNGAGGGDDGGGDDPEHSGAFTWGDGDSGTNSDWAIDGGGLTATLTAANPGTVSKLLFARRFSAASGKRYFEFFINDSSSAASNSWVGFVDESGNKFDINQAGMVPLYNRADTHHAAGMFADVQIDWGGANTTVKVAIDFDNGKVWFGTGANGYMTGANPGDAGDCEAHPMWSSAYGAAPIGGIKPYMDNTFGLPHTPITLRCSASQFLFTPPTGYSALDA